MSRNYTIIISLVIIIILLGVLAYLHFYQATDTTPPDDVFSNLELDEAGTNQSNGGTTDNSGFNDGFETGDDETLSLRQLTTRNVVGFQEVALSTSSEPMVYIAEAGVGHIYKIDLEQGTETRISATTIPDTRQAAFSPDGAYVAIKTTESGGLGSLYLGKLETDGELRTSLISSNVSVFSLVEDSLLYAVHNSGSVAVTARTLESGNEKTLFSIPFREATVVMGTSKPGPHIAYPKTSSVLESFVYQYSNSKLERLPIEGYSLSAIPMLNGVIASAHKENNLSSMLYDATAKSSQVLPLVILPTKCLGHTAETIVCGYDKNTTMRFDTPERWLQGSLTFNDNLWLLNADSSPRQLIDIKYTSGRTVDVTDPAIGTFTNDLYFKNKVDQTLWWYDLSNTSL